MICTKGGHLRDFSTDSPVFFNTVLYKFGNFVPCPVFFNENFCFIEVKAQEHYKMHLKMFT